MVDESNIFNDFLQVLGVKHTVGYSDSRFAIMPFNSLFGLSKLLEEYGIENETLRLASPDDLSMLSVPFIAHTKGGFIIVTGVSDGMMTYLTQGHSERMTVDEFKSVWDRIVLIAYPTSASIEPDYSSHVRDIFIAKAKTWVLVGGAAALFVYLFVANGLYRSWSTWCIALVDLFGLWLTYLLVQKSAKIKNVAADKVCGVLQAGGCDSVLEMKASKFFGIFGWSEVGFSYFSVSLLTLLMFPQWICYLAACNVCCLPFTFWSIWYQKFRAKAWCTLCVSVQASLWLLFFCYLGGGWLKGIFPLRIEFFVLGLTYLTVLLGLNRLMTVIDKSEMLPSDNGGSDSLTSSRDS
ncbi:MAG: cysteine peptidase family C39 domain-containing protein [Bacteroides sp.]|nr:cysteine peptidase family C39 domain-containing protein [Bacteroides sp.]